MSERKPYIPPTIDKHVMGTMNKYAHGVAVPAAQDVPEVSMEKLARTYGSPLFVFFEQTLRKRFRDFYRAFSTRYPKVDVAWSYKTNYLKAICQVFHEEGALAEVVSELEYEKARRLGIDGRRIIVNGPCKAEPMLRRCVEDGAWIQIDNFDELMLLESAVEERESPVDVGIRLNMVTGTHVRWSRFGFHYETGDAGRAVEWIARSRSLRLVGLHMHIGTFVLDLEAYREALRRLLALARWARERHGVSLRYVNAGGGFASSNQLRYQYFPEQGPPTFDAYAEALCEVLHEGLPDEEWPRLVLEPGRALADDAGHLLCTAVANRSTPAGGRAVVVDAGVNLVYTAPWYRLAVRPARASEEAPRSTVVYGPLCMNIDVLREDAPLPTLRPGDRLIVHPVGAYNIPQSMQFITYRPAVVLVGENGEAELIRARERIEDIEAVERMPDRLGPA